MIERVIINENKYFREINIKDYIEKNSLKIKEKYLEIIRLLSDIKINNKKLKEHYTYLDNHSLWEMSLIREKNPLKSKDLHKAIKFLACKEILNEFKGKKIKFFLKDQKLKDSIQSLNNKDVLVYLDKKSKKYNYFYLCSLIKIIKFIILFLFYKKKIINLDNEILIFSYFAHYKVSDDKFTFLNWSGIENIVNKNKISWLNIFIPSQLFKNRNDLYKKKYLDNNKLNFIYDFLTFRIFFNVVYNYLKFVLKYYFIKKNISNNLDNTIKQIINIQEFDFYDSLCGFDLFQNLIWIHLFEKVFSVIPKKKIGFYLFENQSWEKAFVVAWKKYNHGILIGCIPTTINYWHLNYYYSKKECSSNNKVFSPNLVFSNSNYNSKELKNFNLYPLNVKKVESLRFNYLNKVKFNNSSTINNKILFLGDYSDFLNEEFLNSFFNFQKSNKNFKLFVKPHPVSNFFLKKKYLINLIIK